MSETDDDCIKRAAEAYLAESHAMQSGVAFEIDGGGLDKAAATPKMLRVGINSAMAQHAGLAQLLLDKGIITPVEYHEAMAKAMKDERQRYEKHLSEAYGAEVTLA